MMRTVAASAETKARVGGYFPGTKGIVSRRPGALKWVLSLLLLTFLSGTVFAQTKVTLAWNPSTSPDIAGYRVYYGILSGNYTGVVTVGNTNRATITNLKVGTLYYFAAKAVDTAGMESVFSNEVSYTPKAPLIVLKLGFSALKQPVVTGNSLSGLQYDVLSSADLKNWTAIGQTTTDTNGVFTFTDTGTKGIASRYYRVQQVANGYTTGSGATTPPTLQITSALNGDWLLSGTGPVAARYAVRASKDLFTWVTIGTVTIDSTGSYQFVAPLGSGNFFKLEPQ